MSKQERAERTRRALIKSAAAVFEEYGYAQARLALISTGAGVSTGALHFHFENKAAVAAAVETEASRALGSAYRAVRRPARGGRAASPPLQALTDAAHALAHLLRRDTVTRAGFRLSCDTTRTGEVDLRREWQYFVQQMLAEAAGEGSLAAGVNRRDMAAAVVAATIGFEVLGRGNQEWLSRSSVTGFWQLLLPRLATPEELERLDPAGTEAVIAPQQSLADVRPVAKSPAVTSSPPLSPPAGPPHGTPRATAAGPARYPVPRNASTRGAPHASTVHGGR
ncbi:ScbR family autoregulator-binding transcription factor [Streptomyces sp. CC210A]|uniref:ScbR family autoregulator-binding transcription factor n=1 Tax=Streptomyces sp. CC210A TaxID=2898184 RepID=UPI001F216C1C|nr:ScbR family autoregulator-binding transcription factor [Streptomyces sp. CC210A]